MSRGHLVLEHAIDQIKEGHSYRRDLGDLDDLTESIQRFGLLAPIVITTGNALISGNRRLAVLRNLGHRAVPVWVVPGVSDKLSTVLAIQDENTLHKMLTPIEQAELYEELKGLYTEEAERREKANQFGPGGKRVESPTEDSGRVESTRPLPEVPVGGGRSRIQAAKAVTGRDSHGMLDQVVELKTIAASDDEHPEVRQAAAEALLELNADGKVNGRYLRVKLHQALTTLNRFAVDPDEPDAIRATAAAELALVQAQDHPKDAMNGATRAMGRIEELRKEAAALLPKAGWHDVDPLVREKHAIRKLVDLLRREHGWWDRTSPEDFGKYADPEQWDLVETLAIGTAAFIGTARAAREAEAAVSTEVDADAVV